MDPVKDVKRESGGYWSSLSYHDVELKKFFGMREPERQEDEWRMPRRRLILSLRRLLRRRHL